VLKVFVTLTWSSHNQHGLPTGHDQPPRQCEGSRYMRSPVIIKLKQLWYGLWPDDLNIKEGCLLVIANLHAMFEICRS